MLVTEFQYYQSIIWKCNITAPFACSGKLWLGSSAAGWSQVCLCVCNMWWSVWQEEQLGRLGEVHPFSFGTTVGLRKLKWIVSLKLYICEHSCYFQW